MELNYLKDNVYYEMASDILIGNSLGLLKELSEIDAIEIVKCAKELIEKKGQICYKRDLQDVIYFVNREMGGDKKVSISYIDDQEVYEIVDAYDVIPIWEVDNVIDPILINNDTIKELARILINTGDLGLLNGIRIDYALAIIRECVMILSEVDKENKINVDNLIFSLNSNIEGSYRIGYIKDTARNIKQMIKERCRLVTDPKILKNVQDKIKSGQLKIK